MLERRRNIQVKW